MAICIECKEDKLQYQTIQTKRHTTVYICNDCLKKRQRKEVNNARDNKQSV